MKDNLEQWNETQRKSRLKYAQKRRTTPRVKKPTKRGELTFKKAKKKAWNSFSLWVRKSAIESDGLVTCVTCGARKEYKKMQAGHFNPGRHSSILFDERGVHPQCFWCNVMLKGAPREYDAYMVNRYGREIIAELDNLAKNETRKYTVPELLALRDHYDKLVEAL